MAREEAEEMAGECAACIREIDVEDRRDIYHDITDRLGTGWTDLEMLNWI